MFALFHTDKAGRDHYSIAETRVEARAFARDMATADNVQHWGVGRITAASEGHWPDHATDSIRGRASLAWLHFASRAKALARRLMPARYYLTGRCIDGRVYAIGGRHSPAPAGWTLYRSQASRVSAKTAERWGQAQHAANPSLPEDGVIYSIETQRA